MGRFFRGRSKESFALACFAFRVNKPFERFARHANHAGTTARLKGASSAGRGFRGRQTNLPAGRKIALDKSGGKAYIDSILPIKCADKGGAPPTSLSESCRLLRGGRECGANHLGADRPNQTVSRYGTSRYRSGHCWMPDKGAGDCFPAIGVVPRKKQRFRL